MTKTFQKCERKMNEPWYYPAMYWITFIGAAAALCTTLSFLPQVVKVVKTRHTRDLSLGMYVVLVLGLALWLTYGLLTKDGPIIAANVVTLGLALVILGFKIHYK